ncbi:MAG: hypothetical protein QME12_02800 [Nanoarchaeota archaeon]|nr:hypothetical protein [Nanoarchaeota archaeon]
MTNAIWFALELKNEAGEWVVPTLETHPELCKPKKHDAREELPLMYVFTVRGSMDIEQVNILWRQALEQHRVEGEK